MMDVAGTTFDSTELYRRWAAPSLSARNRAIEAEHSEIARAAVARDKPTAVGLLREHYERSLQIILDIVAGLHRLEQRERAVRHGDQRVRHRSLRSI